MIYKYGLPLLAAGLLVFAVGHALYVQRPEPETPPPAPPPVTPFGQTVAGLGMVEPSTEASGSGNIPVGSQVGGTVARVHVRIGQTVQAGDLLFELDNRRALATLKVRLSALAVAQEQLCKLKRQPRPEEVPVSAAQVEVAAANLRQWEDQYERAWKLFASKTIPEQEFVTTQQAYQAAQAQAVQAKATLALLKAGAWELDTAIAAAQVEQARAEVEQAKTTLEVLQVRAPVDGAILQVHVRPGEYVSTFGGQSLILMGNLRPLHVRVSVDEEDLPRLKRHAPARARIRGDTGREEIPLTFVRQEPFVVPKASLTGANTERVDTRVVQVIYAVDPDSRAVREGKLLVGQLVDVFIDTRVTNEPERYLEGKSP